MPGKGDGGLEKAINLVRERGSPAQLFVLARGRVVADVSFGCRTDSLFFLFSASKPLAALLVHMLAEHGELALDHPVAKYSSARSCSGRPGLAVPGAAERR